MGLRRTLLRPYEPATAWSRHLRAVLEKQLDWLGLQGRKRLIEAIWWHGSSTQQFFRRLT